MSTLKENYEKLKAEYLRDAEQLLRVTAYRDGILYMGSGCDQSQRRKDYWLAARDKFVQDNIKEINMIAHGMVVKEIE